MNIKLKSNSIKNCFKNVIARMDLSRRCNLLFRKKGFRRRRLGMTSIFLILSFISCTEDSPLIPDSDLLVVQAYLYANEPVTDIKLTSTVAIDADTSIAPPVNDADVTLVRNDQRFDLVLSPGDSGGYHYPGNDLVVEENDIFKIAIEYKNQNITAETYVPVPPVNMNISDTTLTVPDFTNFNPSLFQDMDEITLSWDNEDNDMFFVVIDNLEKNPQEIESGFRSFAQKFISQPINRNTYPLRFRSFTHLGRHRIKLYRINQEYADLYQSREQDSRDLNEPLTNVVNGLGVFSAFNSDSLFLTVKQ